MAHFLKAFTQMYTDVPLSISVFSNKGFCLQREVFCTGVTANGIVNQFFLFPTLKFSCSKR